jgi:methionyl-tRNA formyltransferase
MQQSEVRLVITRPDRPRGRSKAPQPSPVKEAAVRLGVPVAQPETRADLLNAIAKVSPFDVGVVVAFGMILRSRVLEAPRRGFVNVHFSLLPRWRGAAPVERAILGGDESTGVTLMAMDRGLDAGAIISSRTTPIESGETSGDLLERLTYLGASMLEEDLSAYVDGFLVPFPQPSGAATYAPKIESPEAHLPMDDSTGEVLRRIRAFNPRPGAFGLLDGRRFKIWVAGLAESANLEPGELSVIGDDLCLGVGDGAVLLGEVQAEGSRRMAGLDWARGRRDTPGRLT